MHPAPRRCSPVEMRFGIQAFALTTLHFLYSMARRLHGPIAGSPGTRRPWTICCSFSSCVFAASGFVVPQFQEGFDATALGAPTASGHADHRSMGAGCRLRCRRRGTGTALAQTSTGGLRGFVKDETGGVLAGVTVEASSPSRIGGAAVEVTDGQGLYRFENLPIGEYIAHLHAAGIRHGTPGGVRVEVGRTIQVDTQMKVGNVEQAIVVTGESPVVDALHSGITSNFNQEMLQNIPSARQSVLRHRHLHAGGADQPGAERLEVHHLRVEQRPEPVPVRRRRHFGGVQRRRLGLPEPGHHAGSAGQRRRRVGRIPRFQGGVVNIVTKSGSNSFRGAGSFYIIPPGLVANNTPNEQFPYKVHYNQQATFELGGPIVRDRAWFYGILPAQRGLTTGVGVDPNLDKKGGKSYKPFAKGTVRIGQHDKLNVGWNNNMFCCGATASRTAPLITQTVEHGHNPVLTSQYTHTFGSATLFEARAGGIYIRDNFTPFSDDFATPGGPIRPPASRPSTAPDGSKQFHNRTTVDASVSHSASDFLKGSHDFKFGVQTAYATQRSVSIRFSNVSYTDLNSAPYRRPSAIRRRRAAGSAPPVATCRTTGRSTSG